MPGKERQALIVKNTNRFGNPHWKDVRAREVKKRLTASKFWEYCLGFNKRGNKGFPKGLAKQQRSPSKPRRSKQSPMKRSARPERPAVKWGVEHEAIARQQYRSGLGPDLLVE